MESMVPLLDDDEGTVLDSKLSRWYMTSHGELGNTNFGRRGIEASVSS